MSTYDVPDRVLSSSRALIHNNPPFIKNLTVREVSYFKFKK